MSSLGTLADDVEVPSCSGSARDKEYLLGFANGQDTLSSSAHIGFTVGELVLPNGDKYCGTPLGNMPEGSGKYIWSDGCIYEGEWREG